MCVFFFVVVRQRGCLLILHIPKDYLVFQCIYIGKLKENRSIIKKMTDESKFLDEIDDNKNKNSVHCQFCNSTILKAKSGHYTESEVSKILIVFLCFVGLSWCIELLSATNRCGRMSYIFRCRNDYLMVSVDSNCLDFNNSEILSK